MTENLEAVLFMENSQYKRVSLENRLIDFAIAINKLCEELPHNKLGVYIADQMIRSSASPAFNYGEAQSAESRKDFIHKMKIFLKELRETNVGLKFLMRGDFKINMERRDLLLKENNELISIFVKSIQTASKNL
jgi:four helix bundle protein